MRILILNGSARAHGNTSTLTAAFKRGAEEAGNDVVELPVGRMAIRGCLGCEYCHGRGHGECIIRDDEKEVKEEMQKADMLVLASPIYFFSPSAQLEAAIQRMHAEGIPDNIRESAMILTSGSRASTTQRRRSTKLSSIIWAPGTEASSPAAAKADSKENRRNSKTSGAPSFHKGGNP